MKKNITIVLLCLSSIVFSQEIKGIEAEINFGKYTDCLRPGSICTFNSSNELSNTNAFVFLEKDNSLEVNILRSKISNESELNLFGTDANTLSNLKDKVFKMEEDYLLEKVVIETLYPKTTFTKIVKGSYPINITEKYYTIMLKLE
jgi:hypothetical protein